MFSRPSDTRLIETFNPLPLLGNPHVQTLLGHFLKGGTFRANTVAYPLLLPDGDQMVLHDSVPNKWQVGHPIVVFVHGLGGSHRSPAIQRIARRLYRAGMRIFRLDLRGAGLAATLARKPYHGGCSNDVRAAMAMIHELHPESPLYLMGFSLGGNIALKLAGEANTEAVPGLSAVAVLAPPIDLVRCVELMSLPRNRLYERHYVEQLVDSANRRQQLFPDLPQVQFPRQLTIRQFDELYTAPRWGFNGALDYYRKASSLPLIAGIRIPTLIVTACDDPFIAVEPFQEVKTPPTMELHLTQHGGHLGYLGWDRSGGVRWAEDRMGEWTEKQVGKPSRGK